MNKQTFDILPSESQLSRRLFIGAAATLVAAAPGIAQAWSNQTSITHNANWKSYLLAGERGVVMRRDGPAERVSYRKATGEINLAGYSRACWIMRDVRANKMCAMDPQLLDILCGIQRWMEFNGRTSVIDVTSGFRTYGTNSATEGSAKNSMHLYGRAVDVVISGVSGGLLGAMAIEFNKGGGTGVYLDRGFVHVDTGEPRSWLSRRF
jgi:uncharacterized protein YcbK (DUF882 family)